MVRFLHTADWQIGKPFARFGEASAVLRDARLAAVTAIGQAALDRGVVHVLVAGDVFDGEQLTPVTRRQPVERMRRFETVTWWLLPGNHDPHRPGGLWEQMLADGLPANVRPLLEPVPVALEPGALLLPAPLRTRNEARDLTAWMDSAPTPEGAVRIGLAHGSVRNFSQRQEASNVVDPGRLVSAGLTYLGLGDWHRTLEVGPGVWYAGTPEPDRFASQVTGQVLLVEAGGLAPAQVTPVPVGRHEWRTLEHGFAGDGRVDGVLADWTALADPDGVWQLTLSGALSLSAMAALDAGLEQLEARLKVLSVRRGDLLAAPAADELADLAPGGILGDVTARLSGLREPGGCLPEAALFAAAPDQGTGDPDPAAIASLALQRLWRIAARAGHEPGVDR